MAKEIEKNKSKKVFSHTLKRLAKNMEQGKSITLQVKGKRVYVPAGAVCSIEFEKEGKGGELELQWKW